MAITVCKQKLSKIVENLKFFQKISKKKFFFGFFFSKSWNGGEFTKLRPETESRNRGDHELWNHEMRGSPVLVNPTVSFILKQSISNLIVDAFISVLLKHIPDIFVLIDRRNWNQTNGCPIIFI